MNPEAPSLQPAIDAIQDFMNKQALSEEAQEALREVMRRLERLSIEVKELIDINNRLLTASDMAIKTEFDASTDTLVVRAGGAELKIQLRRDDSNLPIKPNTLTEGEGYPAGAGEEIPLEEAQLRHELETKLEAFYYSAHRVLKLFGRTPALPKIKCMAITQVRNNLIEHPKDGTSYTFGTGSTGPRVKPMHKGDPAWNDEGLVPNTRDFVDAIVTGLAATRT